MPTSLDISRDHLCDWPAIGNCFAGIIANYNASYDYPLEKMDTLTATSEIQE